MAFSAIRVTTAFGAHYDYIVRNYDRWPPFLVKVVGFTTGFFALVAYTITLLVKTKEPLVHNVAYLAIGCAISGSLYALGCSVLDKRWTIEAAKR